MTVWFLQEIASVKSTEGLTPRMTAAETEKKLEKAQADVDRLERQVDRMLDSIERKDKEIDDLRECFTHCSYRKCVGF